MPSPVPELKENASVQKLRTKKLPERIEAQGTLEEYYEKLNKMGYLEVGSGFYSRALSNGDQVIKVAIGDEGYDAYLEYVLANQDNPYFPKVFDVKRFKGVWRNEGYRNFAGQPGQAAWMTPHDVTVVTMEKLKKVKGAKARTLSQHYDIRWSQPVASNKQEKRMFDVLQTLDSSGYRIDMHSGNVMLRGDQPVVIDPVVC